MQLRNCVECGQVFVHPVRSICQDCFDNEEKQFKKIKEFLWDKADATIEEIHEQTQIPEKKIIKFIRDGRIKGHGIENILVCDGCGTPITEGNYCSACRGRIADQLTDKPKKPSTMGERRKSSSNNRMFTADRHKR